MPKHRHGELHLHYETRGNDHGPPLLLLMGWRGNLDWWPAELVARLAPRHRLILVDNRGAGRTGDPGGCYRMAQMADDAAALLDALAIREADVFGVSMGGMIAQELALRHPKRVRRLALASTHSGRSSQVPHHPAARRTMLRILRDPRHLEQHLGALLFSQDDPGQLDPELVADLTRAVRSAPISEWASLKQLVAILRHDTYPRLPKITAPTLVMAGENDRMVVPDHARIIAARIPGARLEIFAGASHALVHEQADALGALVGEFFAAEPARAVA